MKDKKNKVYSLRELMPEFTRSDDKLPSEYKKANRYYNAYKNMECVMNLLNGSDKSIYAEDRDMIVRNMKKIWENYDYSGFVNKTISETSDFTFEVFLELMKEKKNREIFEDLYLNGLYELDAEFYGFSKEDISEYIEKVKYGDISEEMKEMKEDLEMILSGIFTIKDKDNRDFLMKSLSDSMKENAIRVMEYRNMENYLDRITKVIPELRLTTRVDKLPEDLFKEYIRYNGFRGLDTIGKTKYDENGFPKDNITDEDIIKIAEKYYEKLDFDIFIERLTEEFSNKLGGEDTEEK